MWLMLQQDAPDDYVIATGRTHTVENFARLAFEAVGLGYRDFVVQDQQFMRPADVDLLVGDPSRAYKNMGWQARTTFEELVRIMVEAELEKL